MDASAGIGIWVVMVRANVWLREERLWPRSGAVGLSKENDVVDQTVVVLGGFEVSRSTLACERFSVGAP